MRSRLESSEVGARVIDCELHCEVHLCKVRAAIERLRWPMRRSTCS